MASKHLIERCRLNLYLSLLDSVFFRECVSVSVNIPNKLIDGLAEFHNETLADFPKIECKAGAGALIDAIAKQKAIHFNHHCERSLLVVQKRLCKSFLR